MFYFRVIALCLLGTNVLGYIAPYYDLEKADQYFADFIKKYERQYESDEEFSRRFEIFKANLIKLNQFNDHYKHENGGYEITQFTDQDSYVSCARPAQQSNATMIQVEKEFIVNAPSYLDYRQQHLVTRVKNQNPCGSCYIFAAIGNIEAMYAKRTGNLISLSEQQALDCGRGTCDGGAPVNVMNELASQGCESEQDYPYTAVKGYCRFNRYKTKVRVTGGHTIYTPDAETLKGALYQNGAPLSIILFASTIIRQTRGRQILNPYDCQGQRGDHAVLLVGYNTNPATGRPYWICKNSWGTDYGDNGYFYIDFQNRCSFGIEGTATSTVA